MKWILTLKWVVVLHADLELASDLERVVVLHTDLELSSDLERGGGPAR